MAMQQKSMVRDLTDGSVTLTLLTFAFPLFISNALQAAYNIVDMIIVGQFIGGVGMSAVSTGGDLLHLLTFIAMGFSSAGQVLIARSVGAHRMDDVKHLIGNLFTTLLGVSVLVSFVCFFLRTPILNALKTPTEAYAFTMDYTVICIIGLPFIYGYNVVSAILRGMGDSRRPFVFIAIAAILNTILDVVFVVFMDMKVFGAALATVIGQGTSFIASLVYLYRRKESFGFDFKISSFKPEPRTLKALVSLGVPMAIQSAAVNFSKVVLMAWINMEGVVFSALAGIYNKVNTMTGVVSQSFTTAGASMVGQNLGARKYKRIPRIMLTVIICGTVMSTIFAALMIFIPDGIFRMFTSDESVIAIASILIIPTIINFYGSATRSMAFSLINGSGNTKLNLAVAILDGLMSRIGLAALMYFGMHMGSLGCWYGDALAGWMPFVIGMVFFLSGRWKKEKKLQA